MAVHHARVAKSIDVLAAGIDELVAAAAQRDWHAVGRISHELAEDSRSQGYRGVTALAERVREEAHKPDNDIAVRRSLIRLVGTYGRSRET
jgi:hypothetical protein